MNLIKTLILILCCIFATGAFGQKKDLKKANSFYKQNRYIDAISLYEQALGVKDNLNARTKLAYCYRMTNQMVQAETTYSQVVQNPKAKPITYFYYAESLMSNEKYDLAKNWFLKYNQKVPEDKNAIRMAYACDKIKTLNPYFKNVNLSEFEHNSEVDDSAPFYLNDGIVFTSDRSSGINPLKQKSGWTGRDYQRIYFSKGDGAGNYGAPNNFSKKLNDLNKHCGPVSFTADAKTVVFTRTGQMLGKNNSYNIQLYSAESEDGKKWKNVKLLSFCNKERNYMHPALSPDGKKLFFVSDKAGGLGGTDIYMSEKKGDDWGRPTNLGPIINTNSNEAFPFFHSSGKLFFCSKGHLSFGGFDILFSNLKEDGSWQKPVNVGRPINSSYDDISLFLDESMEEGMFASARNGGDDDIYIFKIMEGINAELESLDFEDVAETEVKEEGIDQPTIKEEVIEEVKEVAVVEEVIKEEVTKVETVAENAPKVEEAIVEEVIKEMPNQEVVSKENPIDEVIETNISPSKAANEAEMEELLVKNMEGEMAEDIALEEVREEVIPSMSKEEPKPVETSVPTEASVSIDEEKIEPEIFEPEIKTQPEIRTEPTVRSLPVEKETIDVEEEMVIAEPKVEEEKMDVPAVRSIPVTEEPAEKITEVKKQTTEKVDLMVRNEPTIRESLPEDLPSEIPVRESELKEIVEEQPSMEETSILDREPMESKPPVLMGTESSMLSDEVLELPRLAEFLETNQAIPRNGFVIQGLKYPTGSYLLSPRETRSLGAVLDLMKSNPSLKIEIGSHTPSIGDDVENHNLSRKRAMSIMAYLVFKGISNDRISAKGYGETVLLNNCSNGVNCSNAQHKENDRVEVKVME